MAQNEENDPFERLEKELTEPDAAIRERVQRIFPGVEDYLTEDFCIALVKMDSVCARLDNLGFKNTANAYRYAIMGVLSNQPTHGDRLLSDMTEEAHRIVAMV